MCTFFLFTEVPLTLRFKWINSTIYLIYLKLGHYKVLYYFTNVCVNVLCASGQGVDTVLSETGVQQGEAVGQYLTDITFSNVFVSNLQRAVQVLQAHSLDCQLFSICCRRVGQLQQLTKRDLIWIFHTDKMPGKISPCHLHRGWTDGC